MTGASDGREGGRVDRALTPNLFIIGASKSGSTALNRYLKAHPDIHMSPVKEPCFFVDRRELEEAWPIMARNPASHDRDAYLALFRGGEGAAYRGEASVYYSQSPHRSGVAARLARASPEARILYVVREPVSRAIAHYWQRAKEFQDPLPLGEAIRAHAIYRDTSDYAMQMGEYLRVFDRTRIHVVVAEELRASRRETLARVFDWLGVSRFEHAPEALADVHVSSPVSRRPRFGFVRGVRDSALWAGARRALPEAAVDRLRRLATTPLEKRAVDDRAARAFLREHLAERTPAFEAMIGRRLDLWRERAGG